MYPILITSTHEMDSYIVDLKCVTARNYQSKSSDTVHLRQLAPHEMLYHKYLRYCKNGTWDKEAFDSFFVDRYVTETLFNALGLSNLSMLLRLYRHGVKIVIACDCADEETCHRTIIGGFLEGLGCEVHYRQNQSYIHHFYKYKEKLNVLLHKRTIPVCCRFF